MRGTAGAHPKTPWASLLAPIFALFGVLAGCGDSPRASGSGAADAGPDSSAGDVEREDGVDQDVAVVLCPSPLAECGGACVDPQIDSVHCGGCDVVCGSGEGCYNGECDCVAGRVRCDGACVDTQTTALHCGRCGAACTGDERCGDGECVLSCPEGQLECGDRCVEGRTDESNCGGCDVACEPVLNQSAFCLASSCERNCLPNFFDLDGIEGCEYACVVAFPDNEICDGVDNDCDGRVDVVDNDFEPTSCPLHVGVCAGVVARCVDNADVPCDDETYRAWAGDAWQPDVETLCDGLDNDCNGVADELCCGTDEAPVEQFAPPSEALYRSHRERLVGVLREGDDPRVLVLRDYVRSDGQRQTELYSGDFSRNGGAVEADAIIATDVVDASLAPRADGAFDLAVVRSPDPALLSTAGQSAAFYRLDADGAVVWGPETIWFVEGTEPTDVTGVTMLPLGAGDVLLSLQVDAFSNPHTTSWRLPMGDALPTDATTASVEDGHWAGVAARLDDEGNLAVVVSSVGTLDRSLVLWSFTPPLSPTGHTPLATVRSRDLPHFTTFGDGTQISVAGDPDGGLQIVALAGTGYTTSRVAYPVAPLMVQVWPHPSGRTMFAGDAADGTPREAIGFAVFGADLSIDPVGYISERYHIHAAGFIAGTDRDWFLAESEADLEPVSALFAYPLAPSGEPLCFGARSGL